jgi:hypothetical protein
MKPVTYRQVLEDRLAELGKVARGEPMPKGLPTGFKLWDKNGGLKRGVIHLIAGDSGEGKSFVKSHIIEAAAKAGHRVDVFDLEDPARETADRTLAKVSNLEIREIQGKVTQAQVNRLAQAADLPWADLVNVYDELDSADQMLEVMEESDAELTILEYLQLVPEGPDGMEATLRRLARAAQKQVKRTNGTCLAFSQVKAEVSGRGRAWFTKNAGRGYPEAIQGTQPGPGKADIAWCGAWGERAKSVTYIWRPGRWGQHYGFDVEDDRLHLIQSKSSFGREGSIIVGFDAAHGRLFNL